MPRREQANDRIARFGFLRRYPRAGKHWIAIALMVSGHLRASGFSARLRLFNLKAHIEDLARIVDDRLDLRFGFRSPVPRCPSGVKLPNHRLSPRLNVDMFNGHFLLALAAVFVQDLDLAGIDGEELLRVF